MVAVLGSGWEQRLRDAGPEPDPRFVFANERTFLAWIRTALAFMAAGVALEAFVPQLVVAGVREVLASALVVLGAVISAVAFRRWYRSELAMRTGLPLPALGVAPWLAYGLAMLALAALVLALIAQT
jgi:putative membrane protein